MRTAQEILNDPNWAPRKGMTVEIYKPADGSDCTNGGVTSRAKTALIVGDILSVPRQHWKESAAVIGKVPEIVQESRDWPVLRIEKRRMLDACSGCGDNAPGEYFWYAVAVPADLPEGVRPAFGGNFIWSCDSWFRRGISEYPIPVHDHIVRSVGAAEQILGGEK